MFIDEECASISTLFRIERNAWHFAQFGKTTWDVRAAINISPLRGCLSQIAAPLQIATHRFQTGLDRLNRS